MPWKILFLVFFFFISLIFVPLFFLLYYQYLSFAAPTKANILVDIKKTIGPVPDRWKALAQGGEEKGVRMLANVIPQIAALLPKYIRIDHIYDFYNVVNRDTTGNLTFDWQQLDETVCDIYRTGAKPFFVLGYMPPVLSKDGTLVSLPTNWNEWSLTVQKTIERYSGQGTRLCGQIAGAWLNDIYYEVWNEPDLESFGKWSLYPGDKSYQTLYFYTSLGALQAKNVNRFSLGGPASSSLYKNWVTVFLDFVTKTNVKFDFFSWHHYSQNISGFSQQIADLNTWLSEQRYAQFRLLPRIISEWGYDSNPNPIADTNIGAAHTLASIRNFFEQNIDAAFLFEIKDGPAPRWGILSYQGEEKPRYKALRMLNQLEGQEVFIEGEGTYVTALSSISQEKVTLVLVNYDPKNLNNELVPVRIINLSPGTYTMTTAYLDGKTSVVSKVPIPGTELQKSLIMPPNIAVAIELKKEQ
ncbi:hypothetical protein HY357_03505 [Candidatus Roizmanbacteria bacterium]|nr:hypothetical protein [Candidatus Roizmanbacteria bacterium]